VYNVLSKIFPCVRCKLLLSYVYFESTTTFEIDFLPSYVYTMCTALVQLYTYCTVLRVGVGVLGSFDLRRRHTSSPSPHGGGRPRTRRHLCPAKSPEAILSPCRLDPIETTNPEYEPNGWRGHRAGSSHSAGASWVVRGRFKVGENNLKLDIYLQVSLSLPEPLPQLFHLCLFRFLLSLCLFRGRFVICSFEAKMANDRKNYVIS